MKVREVADHVNGNFSSTVLHEVNNNNDNNDDGDDDDDNNNNNNEVKELQETAILGTAHILRKVLT